MSSALAMISIYPPELVGMMPNVSCPKCGKQLHYPVESAGKRARCPQCQAGMLLPGSVPKEVSYMPGLLPPSRQKPPGQSEAPPRPPVLPIHIPVGDVEDDQIDADELGEIEPPRRLVAEFNAVRLRFPNLCCCCGQRSPRARYQASHTRTRGIRVVRRDTRVTEFPICSPCADWLEDIEATKDRAERVITVSNRGTENAWTLIALGVLFAPLLFGIVFLIIGMSQLGSGPWCVIS